MKVAEFEFMVEQGRFSGDFGLDIRMSGIELYSRSSEGKLGYIPLKLKSTTVNQDGTSTVEGENDGNIPSILNNSTYAMVDTTNDLTFFYEKTIDGDEWVLVNVFNEHDFSNPHIREMNGEQLIEFAIIHRLRPENYLMVDYRSYQEQNIYSYGRRGYYSQNSYPSRHLHRDKDFDIDMGTMGRHSGMCPNNR